MALHSLLADAKFLACSPDAAAAQTDLDGAVLDLGVSGADGGYDRVLFIAHVGDVTSGSVLELQCQGSALANGSSPSTEATTGTITAGASDCDDKLLVLDVARPANRYVFSRLKRGTQNAAVNSVVAILYKSRNGPVTQTDVVKSAFAVVR